MNHAHQPFFLSVLSGPLAHGTAPIVGGRVRAALIQGGADIRGKAYLGSFTLRASKHASGTFRVRAAMGQGASLIRSSSNKSIEIANPAGGIHVSSPRAMERSNK